MLESVEMNTSQLVKKYIYAQNEINEHFSLEIKDLLAYHDDLNDKQLKKSINEIIKQNKKMQKKFNELYDNLIEIEKALEEINYE